MNLNFFTRCCLYDKTLLEQKQKILDGRAWQPSRRQSIHRKRETFTPHADPFPGESSGRFYSKTAHKSTNADG